VLGLLLVDKPLGITSHDVVNAIRRRFHTKRVGHAGTLDPLATGLLVVAVGPATRFLQYLPLEPKEYVARVRFGEATSTYDAEGEVTHRSEPPSNLADALAAHLPSYLGLVAQVPPMHSAVKKDGKPLYAYARAGLEIERESRTIHIGRLEVEAIEGDEAVIRIECSGGTYIRTLAHDLGLSLGCGAHLTGLVRTRVGKFRLDDANALDSLASSQLIGLKEALPPVPLLELNSAQVEDIRHGKRLAFPEPFEGRVIGLLDPEGFVVGMARVQGNFLQPECVIPAEVPIAGS